MSLYICPRCHLTHPADAVMRIGRFDQGRPQAFLARPLGETFPTREAAWDAICTFWAEKGQE